MNFDFTFLEFLSKYSGEHNKIKLYECRHSIIRDGAPYPLPKQDLVAAAPDIVDYLECPVY